MIDIRVDGKNIALSGKLTHHTVDAVWKKTPVFTEPEYSIDLAAVEGVDSAGLALLICWHESASRRASKLSFNNVPDKLREISRLANLGQLFG